MDNYDLIKTIKGDVEIILRDAKTGKIKSTDRVKNVFTTAGKAALASRLAGQGTGQLTYCAVGTDATAPVAGNTTLGTELYRKLISVKSSGANVATLTTFFTTSEGNGALKEAGLFGDSATGTADSGTLFCHTAINRTKTSGDTLTINWSISVG